MSDYHTNNELRCKSSELNPENFLSHEVNACIASDLFLEIRNDFHNFLVRMHKVLIYNPNRASLKIY